MRVIRVNEVSAAPLQTSLFTGGQVTAQPLLTDSNDFEMRVVNFAAGARNKFHAHDRQQVLIVTAGRGIVATEAEEIDVGVGDVIVIPAGEKHWHGAGPGEAFSHIYIVPTGAKVTQLED